MKVGLVQPIGPPDLPPAKRFRYICWHRIPGGVCLRRYGHKGAHSWIDPNKGWGRVSR